ncbi:hypothetical protein [Nannocystis bainbridge]|uniref:OmpA family protein n=1 Tax=Nannocystis bainbridge TaxID=2995303 RepID=A0ABT5DSQ8_9BACT|nr:hypothetical protein [Nannocystis bainbridge]MDC0715773.1 hypothetical protein [Nannocystis bainbridge]
MAVRRGISILDLLPQTTGVALQIPDGIVEQIGILTILDHRSTTSDDYFLHEGTLQSIADALDLDTSDWALRIPGLTHGLPFRLAIRRPGAPPAGQQEGEPSLWTIDIQVWDVEVLLPGVRPARPVGGTGVTPLTLEPLVRPPPADRVYLVARGVVRISGGGAGGTQVQVVDSPDPLDPTAPTGAVIRLTARPPSFLFGSSQYGMTLDQFVIDLSSTYTPAEIMARGHDEAWQGLAFKETTFYFPPETPLVHSLSVSARDVILGDPGGLQGELRIEFGQDFADVYNSRLAIKQQQGTGEVEVPETTIPPKGTALEYAIAVGPGGESQRLRAVFEVGAGELIPGHTDLAVVGVWWKLPDDTEGTTPTTPWFEGPASGRLRYRLRVGHPSTADNTATPPTAIPADQRELVEVSVSFPRQAGGPTGTGPLVDATIGADTLNNVLHLRGPRELLATVNLQLRSGTGDWTLGTGGAPTSRTGVASFALPLLPVGTTTVDLVVSNSDGSRRVRIDVVPTGPIAVGHQSTAVNASPSRVTVVGTGPATPTAVIDTFLATPFHKRAERPAAPNSATIAAADITVPQGADAEVEVPVPTGATDPPPQPVLPNETPRVVQVQYAWDQNTPIRVLYPYAGSSTAGAGLHEPDAHPLALGFTGRPGPGGNNVHQQLTTWIAALGTANGRKFYVLGRTDDLKLNGNKAENDTYNNTLATRRAEAARDALIAAGVALTDITIAIESAGFGSPPAGSPPARFSGARRLALPWPQSPTFAATAFPVWNRKWNADSTTDRSAAINDSNRPPYRCAEIYVVDTTAPPAPGPVIPGPGVPTRFLVPGPDGAPDPGVSSTTTKPPPTDYRVRLRVKWDSPTVVSPADAIPTEAEALVAWKAAQIELPASTSGNPPPLPPPTGPDYWELLLRWAYDARSGQTEASGALSLPDGALTWQSDALAGALAFGPVITALADPADVVDGAFGQFVAAAAILAVGAAIGELLNTGSGPESSVDIDKLAISYKWNGAAQVAATVDYTIDLRINVSVAGAGSLTGHLRMRYKGVGLRFAGKPEGGLAGVALTYDSMSVEVVDPGTWSLGGPLGNLIRIAASRMGHGSQWMEFDLEFALDLGVVRLEGATIRVNLPDESAPFKVEFRGLTASIDIPGALKGKGSVTLGDGGSFRALLSLEVIPAKLSAYGALAVDQDFVSVEVGVQLPVGIPLGATGFGIFGFIGRFVANGTRNLEGLTNPEPVQRQLDWYTRAPQLKYKRKSGQYAFGVGAVVGTLPDSGFTFNAEGSLTIGFPDVSVIFGIDAKLVTQRKSAATESGTAAPPGGLRILGMVLIEPDSIMIGVRGSYDIPKVLKLEIPISAYFPLAGGDAWYIRIGSDNHATRPGNPVSIILLPTILDVRAWAFVMIEERQLHGLGGTLVPLDLAQPLDFDGFSIGMGAGFDLKWSAGPFKLEISAFLLVGLGTKPLLFAGAAGIKGELDLVLISVGVDGLVHFHVSPGYSYFEGHFCGHVDLFFFEISGCVDIRIGDDPPSNIPVPESPIAGMDLCDHLAVVKGAAARNGVGAAPTVWPDTIAVLRFAHYAQDGLGGTADFERRLAAPAALSPWSGSTELKYAFRLKQVTLWRLTGADPNNAAHYTHVPGPFDAAWWMPSWRKSIIEGGDNTGPSTEEGRELGLFSWDPRAWSRWLGEGSQEVPGNPGNTVEHLCDEVAAAGPSCAYGRARVYAYGVLGAFTAEPPAGAVFPSRFKLFARFADGLDAGMLAGLGADAGWTWIPGAVAPLHGAIDLHGTVLEEGWRFPSWRAVGKIVGTAPIVLPLSKPLLEGELVLEVCSDKETAVITSGVCDPMPSGDGLIEGFVGASKTKYSGSSLQPVLIGQVWALRLLKNVLEGQYPGTIDAVAVDVDPNGSTATLTAYGPNNVVLGTAQTVGAGRQWLRIEAPGIVKMRLTGEKQPVLYEVCWGRKRPILDLVPFKPSEWPRVIAIDIHDKQTALEPEVLKGDGECPKVRYKLPQSDGWTRLEVAPWNRGDVALVALCGVTMEARAAQQAEVDYRASLVNLLQLWVAAALDNKPTHKTYLEDAATYEIRVEWQYQGFRPASPGQDPPPPSAGGWLDPPGLPERYRFKTAAFGLAAAPPAVQSSSLENPAQGGPGFDERTFDPRGVARYLTRAAPSHEDPPHFLDDHAGFWFMVDHLESLVDKYDRTLQVKVLHTRPPAGSIDPAASHPSGGLHVLDVTVAVEWKVDTSTWFLADQQLVEAVVAAPCVGGTPAVGSSSVSVTADLEPRTEYDLLLNAAPKIVDAFPEVPIARSHFRTSRYRNPTEMLRALGFATPVGLSPPNDALIVAPLPAGSLAIGDTELDAALTALGLDPWPLPPAPRTTLLWQQPAAPNQPWRIAGVLIEADEPVWRAGLRTGALNQPTPPPRLEVMSLQLHRTFEQLVPLPAPPHLVTARALLASLTERVRNAAGTRCIFTANAPIAMTGGRIYDLELRFRENGSPGAIGAAPLVDRPLFVLEEGD